MRGLTFRGVKIVLFGLLLLSIPAISHAQSEQASSGPPPIAPPLVREGDLAVSLGAALGVASTDDEVEAETEPSLSRTISMTSAFTGSSGSIL